MKKFAVPGLFLLALTACFKPSPAPTPTATITVPPVSQGGGKLLYGVTFDSVENVPGIVAAVQQLPQPSAVRLVFDYPAKPAAYQAAVAALLPVTMVVAQPFDSTYIGKAGLDTYKARFESFLDTFKDSKILWEVGNEMNGEWAGKPAEVAAKVVAGYQAAKARGRKTLLTPILNNDGKTNCWAYPAEDMLPWLDKYIPKDVQPDYVLVSFYEQDCPGVKPDWRATFKALHARFPGAYVGFGEVGTEKGNKVAYAQKYYSLRFPDLPYYIGGWFWWYGTQDLIGKTSVLNAIKLEAE